MPKKKIKKAVSKRFKVTKTGKVMFGHQNQGHLMRKKSAKQKRRLSVKSELKGLFGRKIKMMLGHV